MKRSMAERTWSFMSPQIARARPSKSQAEGCCLGSLGVSREDQRTPCAQAQSLRRGKRCIQRQRRPAGTAFRESAGERSNARPEEGALASRVLLTMAHVRSAEGPVLRVRRSPSLRRAAPGGVVHDRPTLASRSRRGGRRCDSCGHRARPRARVRGDCRRQWNGRPESRLGDYVRRNHHRHRDARNGWHHDGRSDSAHASAGSRSRRLSDRGDGTRTGRRRAFRGRDFLSGEARGSRICSIRSYARPSRAPSVPPGTTPRARAASRR